MSGLLLARLVAAMLVTGGIAYLLLALFHLWRYRPDKGPVQRPSPPPPVTIMIPVHDRTARLADCVETLCRQDYSPFQVIFGLHAPDDPARPVIERVMAAHPALDTALVIDPRRIGANPKNCNLANMMAAVKHDILVMVDSDVLVEPDFLLQVVRSLDSPGVGGVTCLYCGDPLPGLAPALGALYINDWFIPSVLVDLRRREMDVCYGAAIAVTRQALERIGGFEAMADAVAQDFVFGKRLREAGYYLRLAPSLVRTVVAEPDLPSLLRHELRWNRAVRAVRPLDHLLSVFMHPLVPGGLILLATWPTRYAVGMVGLHIALRLALHHLMLRRFRLPALPAGLVPVREVLNAGVWAAAFLSRKIHWGRQTLVTGGKNLSMRATDRETVE